MYKAVSIFLKGDRHLKFHKGVDTADGRAWITITDEDGEGDATIHLQEGAIPILMRELQKMQKKLEKGKLAKPAEHMKKEDKDV